MPPRKQSRYTFCFGYRDADGDFVLSDPEPYRYRELVDTRLVRISQGETIFSVAGREFGTFSTRPAGLWWIIADFQPEPIHDPTLELPPGTMLYIPSDRTIAEEIFSEVRRDE